MGHHVFYWKPYILWDNLYFMGHPVVYICRTNDKDPLDVNLPSKGKYYTK